DIQQKATSLAIETNQFWNTKDLVQAILQRFEVAYKHYMQYGFSDIRQKWESYGFRIGETIQVKTAREVYHALFMGIGDDGALLVKTHNGNQRLYSAEISWGGNLYADKNGFSNDEKEG